MGQESVWPLFPSSWSRCTARVVRGARHAQLAGSDGAVLQASVGLRVDVCMGLWGKSVCDWTPQGADTALVQELIYQSINQVRG